MLLAVVVAGRDSSVVRFTARFCHRCIRLLHGSRLKAVLLCWRREQRTRRVAVNLSQRSALRRRSRVQRLFLWR